MRGDGYNRLPMVRMTNVGLLPGDTIADGNPIVWLHRLAGRQIHLVPGSELVEPLFLGQHKIPMLRQS